MRPSTSAQQSPSDLSGFPEAESARGGRGGKTAVLAGGDRATPDKMQAHQVGAMEGCLRRMIHNPAFRHAS